MSVTADADGRSTVVAPSRIPWRALTRRTWLLRGAAAAILLMLVGSWVVGVAGRGDDSPASERAEDPVPADTPTPEELDPSALVETASPTPSADATPSEDPLEVETPGAVVPVAEDGPRSPEQQGPASTPKPPKPTPTRSSTPTPKPTPKPTPTPSPTQPSNGCTDLSTVVDCVLAPVTTRP